MKLRKSSGRLRKPRPFIIRQVQGESMLPTLRPGQLVIGRQVNDVRSGDVVIVTHNGLEKIKRIEKQQDNLLYLLGDNPASSTDSRNFGWVQADSIMVKVVWPKLT